MNEMHHTSIPEADAPLDMVTIGEAMALFIAGQPGPLEQVQSFSRAAAGAELNVAVGMRRLGFKVGYVSRVGNDSFGSGLLLSDSRSHSRARRRRREAARQVSVMSECPGSAATRAIQARIPG